MKQVKEILAKEMTRKQFLQVAGMGILTLFGVSNFLAYILKNSSKSSASSVSSTNASTSHGFGSRTFGN